MITVNKKMCRGCTFMHYCRQGNISAVNNMLETNKNINLELGLSIACRFRQMELAQILINTYGAMVCDAHIQQACNADNFDVAIMLLQHGGSCEALSFEHTKAILNMGYACNNKHYERLLQKKSYVSNEIHNCVSLQFPLFDLNMIPIICDYVEYE